jgi:hypothetical protein
MQWWSASALRVLESSGLASIQRSVQIDTAKVKAARTKTALRLRPRGSIAAAIPRHNRPRGKPM